MPYKPGDKVMIISNSEDNPHPFSIGSIQVVSHDYRNEEINSEYPIELCGNCSCINDTECIQVREDCDAA